MCCCPFTTHCNLVWRLPAALQNGSAEQAAVAGLIDGEAVAGGCAKVLHESSVGQRHLPPLDHGAKRRLQLGEATRSAGELAQSFNRANLGRRSQIQLTRDDAERIRGDLAVEVLRAATAVHQPLRDGSDDFGGGRADIHAVINPTRSASHSLSRLPITARSIPPPPARYMVRVIAAHLSDPIACHQRTRGASTGWGAEAL